MSEPTIEQVELVEGRPKCNFKFYEGTASGVPVLDVGELFAALLEVQGGPSVNYQVIGDTNDSFTVLLTRGGAHTLAIVFTAMSFGDIPPEVPPMHKAQYHRFHVIIMDYSELRQISIPFIVPEELAYNHELGAWGVKVGSPWTAPKEDVYDAIRLLVSQLITWLNITNTRF